MCPPEKYIETTFSFRRHCFQTKWLERRDTTDDKNELHRVFGTYAPSSSNNNNNTTSPSPSLRVTKAVHLLRDPWSNIVSRYHLERQLPGRLAANYTNDRAGFRAYCQQAVDPLHARNEQRFSHVLFSEGLGEWLQQIPCHADFVRYMEWHNLAFTTTRDLGLETMVLHYEWYTTRLDAVARSVLDFLELPLPSSSSSTFAWTPFTAGKVYDVYFTLDERRALYQAFAIMASPETWSHVQQYFDAESRVAPRTMSGSTTKTEVPATRPHKKNTTTARAATKSYIVNVASDEKQQQQPSPRQPSPQQQQHRPPLDTLVQEGSSTNITGDVQFLMDFAVVGYPKTATSNLIRWLAHQPHDIATYEHELYHLKDGEPADMVRKLYALNATKRRGYKAPRDIHNPRAIRAFAEYWPHTKLIVGLRHPVLWFESFYNYRMRDGFQLPADTAQLNRTCVHNNVCTEEIRYHDHLARLGKTQKADPDELALLSPVLPRYRKVPPLPHNPILLYEISQLPTADFRTTLQDYLGLEHPLTPLEEPAESRVERVEGEIDICDAAHAVIRTELMEIARRSSRWILDYFLAADGVTVANAPQFRELLESWNTNPCVRRNMFVQA